MSAIPVWFFFVPFAQAHEIRPAVVTVTFTRPAFDVEISANVEAMVAGISPKHADTSESPNAQRYDEMRQLPPDALLKRVRDVSFEFISVDDFDAADLAAGRRSKPTLRSVA